jgi:hypothetical protein
MSLNWHSAQLSSRQAAPSRDQLRGCWDSWLTVMYKSVFSIYLFKNQHTAFYLSACRLFATEPLT